MNKSVLFILIFLLSLASGNILAQDSNQVTHRKVGKNIVTEYENYKNFRFTLGGGYAYWLGDNPDRGSKTVNKFFSDLRHGFNLDMEAQYFTHEYMGFGLNGTFVQYSNDQMKKLSMKETDKIIFLGATWNGRYKINKWALYSGLGLGPLFYSAESSLEEGNIKLNKTVFGMTANIACEYQLNESMGAGLKLAVTSGSFKIENTNNRLSVSSLMLTGFISFRTR